MADDGFTRRRVLGAGLAATAAGALAPSASAARRPALFELDLTDGTAVAASAGWRTLPPRRAPRRFDLLGLRWAAGASPEALVRTRRERGEWSDWLSLHAMGDHGPDAARGGRARVLGTEPAWTDTADHFQLRLRGAAPGLRVRFVRAKPTAAVARSVTGRLARRASARASQAPGATPPMPVVTRAQWGADTVPPREEPEYGVVQLAFVHHTVSANAYTREDSAAIVLGIARYHRDSNRWNDIGYNFLVDKFGQVFEGRAGGMGLAVVGAQAQGFNAVSTGIACLGDFRAVGQSDPGLIALAELLAWKLAVHGVPPEGQVTVTSAGGSTNRHPSGTAATFERIAGHRDSNATTCPGEALYAQLPALRAATARRTPTVAPAVPAAPAALTMTVAAARVRYPRPARVSGHLRFGDGSVVTGAPLELQFQPAGGAWQPLAVARADAAGRFAGALEMPSSGLVRAVFPGGDGRPVVEASPVAVAVLPRLTLALASRRVRRGTAVAVSGQLGPPPPGGRVVCLLERRAGSRWVVVQRKRINVRRGAFATKVRPKAAGEHRVSIVSPDATKRLSLRATTAVGRGGGASAT